MMSLLTIFSSALSAVTPVENTATFWLPQKASTFANDVDIPFYFVYWVSVFFFVLIVGLMVWFMFRYRRPAEGTTPDTHTAPVHNTSLEVTWSAIPLVLVIVMFYLGFKGAMNMAQTPEGAMTIPVQAQKWSWSFTYPNGWVDSELHVPANMPIRLLMSSPDVIHSLFIPDFRVKRDVVPGKYSELWFESPMDPNATEPRVHHLFCTEFCGTLHSTMITKVYVYPTYEAYEAWLNQVSDLSGLPPEVAGRKLYETRGCSLCHSVDGAVGIGPTFKGLWSRTVKGETTFVDGSNLASLLRTDYEGMPENYIIESLWDPQKRVVAGYSPVMPPARQISQEYVGYLIAYFKSLENAAAD